LQVEPDAKVYWTINDRNVRTHDAGFLLKCKDMKTSKEFFTVKSTYKIHGTFINLRTENIIPRMGFYLYNNIGVSGWL